MTASAAVRSRVAVAGLSAALALTHGIGAIFSGNQNSYLLHAAAHAGWPGLAADWTAGSPDPFPVFTALATPMLRVAPAATLVAAHLLLVALYGYALFRIVAATWDCVDASPRAIAVVALLFFHSRLLASVSMRTTGVDARALLIDGVASQYVLGPVFQPSMAGVFILLAVALFLDNRPWLAVVSTCLAATIHPTYLLSAALLTLSFAAVLAGQRRLGLAVAVAAVSLVLVLPVVAYAATTFAPTDRSTFDRAAHLLADDRIAIHARVATWFGAAAIVKAALCAAALWIVRRRPIFPLLWPAFVFTVVTTAALALYPNPVLALQFPWRLSVWLMPIATTLLTVRWCQTLGQMPDRSQTTGRPVSDMAIAAVAVAGLTAYGVAGSIREARSVDRRPDAALRRSVAGAVSPRDIYLIPPEMEEFRLRTGAAIVVDAKTHPYKDVDVLEWKDRLDHARAFYAGRGDARCLELAAIARQYRATRVVTPAADPVACRGTRRIYADDAFSIFAIE